MEKYVGKCPPREGSFAVAQVPVTGDKVIGYEVHADQQGKKYYSNAGEEFDGVGIA